MNNKWQMISPFTKSEGRLESRFLCADLVQVSWVVDGLVYKDGGNLEDVSPSGCRLLMDQAIPEATPIEIRCGENVCNGTVRYCRSSDIGFDLGIQFDQIGTWSREEFQPSTCWTCELCCQKRISLGDGHNPVAISMYLPARFSWAWSESDESRWSPHPPT